MSKITLKNVVRSIAIVLLMLETIILILVALANPINEEIQKTYMWVFEKLIPVVITLVVLSMIMFITEHKIYNKNEKNIDENDIPPKLDINNIQNKDILYLSANLNQKYPTKKDIILLIMQLINNKAIDLSIVFDGDKYQYFIQKRENIVCKNEVEEALINYIFIKENKVDLIKTIQKIYKSQGSNKILEKCNKYIENVLNIKQSSIKLIYKIIAGIVGLILGWLSVFAFVGFFLSTEFLYYIDPDSITPNLAFVGAILAGLFCIMINFISLVLLKKVNLQYQYDNDACFFVIKVCAIFEFLMLISYAFPAFETVQYIFFTTYILALLTIMIQYNTHFVLSSKDLFYRAELLSLKKYLKNMEYLKDKEFGNIITYEQYIMYGFLFNITIKINNEFDMLQKELKNTLKREGILYWELLQEDLKIIEMKL